MRIIFHIDVNSAFLSWTSVRRLQEGKEDLRAVPAVIGGDPSLRTSVVLAKSMKAKACGIRTGEPMSMAVRKCPGLVIAQADFAWYRECSKRFIALCRQYAPVVEQVSIDECFCDFTGVERARQDAVALADEIRERVKDSFGFTVNVGIGENRLLAKTASDFEKPDRTHTLYRAEIPAKFWPLPVSDLLFVGRSTAARLNGVGIRTIGALAATDERVLTSLFGPKEAASLRQRAQGIDNSPVLAHPEETKGFSMVTTFEEDIRDRETAEAVLLDLSNALCFRMREEGFRARSVGVRIRSGNYSVRVTRSHQRKLEMAANSTALVYRTARQLLSELWDGHTGLRLIGIFLGDITRENSYQMSLFPQEQERQLKEERADRAMDELRKKFGAGIVSLGMAGRGGHGGRNEKENGK